MILKTLTQQSMFTILPAVCVLIGPAVQPAAAVNERENTISVQVNDSDDNVRINSTIIIRENNEELRVVRRNGDVRVQLDGEDVPAERLRRSRGRLAVLDAEGNELHVLRLLPGGGVEIDGERSGRPTPPAPPRPPSRAPGGGFGPPGGIPGGGESVFWSRVPDGPPRGQIGIGMGQIDAALAAQLKLNRDEVVLITHVLDDAPAARAGLQQHDIIIKVDGESPATHERIRRIVRDKEPGEQLTLTVLRAGNEHEISIEIGPIARRGAGFGATGGSSRQQQELELRQLEARDLAEVLQQRLYGIQDSRPLRRLRGLRELMTEEHIEKLKDQLMRELEESLDFDITDELREKLTHVAQRMAAQASELTRRFSEEFAPRLMEELEMYQWTSPGHPFRFEGDDSPSIVFFREDDERGMVVRPSDVPRPPRRAETAERLDERFSNLEQRLDRLERMLEQLLERN